jgi:ubiquinone/menaquinone biosynthesis C-methylase UbiE
MKTSWNKVADWYDKHLSQDKDNYHNTLVIPRLLRLVEKYIPNQQNKIIDLASGQGLVTFALAKKGYQMVGADISPELVKKAQQVNLVDSQPVKFFVENASKLSPGFISRNANADAVTIVLAIQNIEDVSQLLEGCNKLLHKNGYLVIVMNHPAFRIPKMSAWGFDGNKEQYRKVWGYYSKAKFAIDMLPGTTVKSGKKEITWSFHRPLEYYVKELANKGFSVVDLEEWLSNKTSQPGARAQAENKARKEIPLFMAIVAQKRTP